MDFDTILDKLMDYYKVRSVTDLAEKIEAERSTVNGWKSRKSIGALLQHLSQTNPETLASIFTPQNNVFGNVQGVGQNFGQTGTVHNNSSALTGMDKAIVALFENVYQKMEKEDKLQELFSTLSQLYFGQK